MINHILEYLELRIVKSEKLFPLEDERFIRVDKELIERYGYLIRKYFEGK